MSKACPKCNEKAIEVRQETVNNFLSTKLYEANRDWYCCINSNCDICYFDTKEVINTNSLKVKLWFKHTSDDVMICYCAGITRSEIKEAVNKGCFSIDAVRTYLKKHNMGECIVKNPLGRCCHEVFKKEIENCIDAVEENEV